jgi:hypothetical protein
MEQIHADHKENRYWLGWNVKMLKHDWTKGRQEAWRVEKESDKIVVCHRFCSTCTLSTLPTKLLKGFEASEKEK